MTAKRMLVSDLVKRIERALSEFDIHDDVHHVMIYRGGRVFDAKLELSKSVYLPDGTRTRAYGLIFSEATADASKPDSTRTTGTLRRRKAG